MVKQILEDSKSLSKIALENNISNSVLKKMTKQFILNMKRLYIYEDHRGNHTLHGT